MNPINTDTYYKIIKITDEIGNQRTDGRYPLRIGRRFKFLLTPEIGVCMLLDYKPRENEDYFGVLKTSSVQGICYQGNTVIINTYNSVYYFEKESTE